MSAEFIAPFVVTPAPVPPIIPVEPDPLDTVTGPVAPKEDGEGTLMLGED